MQIFKSNAVKSAIIGIYTLLFISFVIAGLYLVQIILIPLALAILLAFLFSPLVSTLEIKIGRILALILVILIMSIVTGAIFYALSKEFIRFTTNISIYKTNIDTKVNYLKEYKESIFQNSATLQTKLSGNQSHLTTKSELINFNQLFLNFFATIFGSFINIVLTILLILIFFCFIIMDREDLGGRFIRLIGQERIATTTHAINDASSRVSKYLWMLLLINFLYGIAVAIGLYFLGIPSPFLWGAFSGILRFIPYVGVWIAALVPIGLSFAISNYWILPLLTISLFVILEIVCSNIFEPWVYGIKTGVSSTALLIAALFWTLLWGPVGLVLSTPLTVCLVVLGRHVPRLEFLSILLSDEEPLTLSQEYYHRLIVGNINQVMQLSDEYLKDNSLTSLYNNVLIPVIVISESDHRREILDDEQLYNVQQNLFELIEDLNIRSQPNEKTKSENKDLPEKEIEGLKSSQDLIMCIPAKATRDELVGEMLTQLLTQKKYNTLNVSSQFKIEKILELIKTNKPKVIIVSVVPPSTTIQARHLSKTIKSHLPTAEIIVGLWAYTDNVDELEESLLPSGTNKIVTNLEDAIVEIDKNSNDVKPSK